MPTLLQPTPPETLSCPPAPRLGRYVDDGFGNLTACAMQLAARHILVQLERPLGALFGSGRHQPTQMAALVDHFLSTVREGVAGDHATRTAATCLEQLLLTCAAPRLSHSTLRRVAKCALAACGAQRAPCSAQMWGARPTPASDPIPHGAGTV